METGTAANPCLLIDVAEADPTFGVASAKLLDSKRADGRYGRALMPRDVARYDV